MTEPDEATMPDRTEKAHGDALEDLVGGTSSEGADGGEDARED